jgi:hypothetical protein
MFRFSPSVFTRETNPSTTNYMSNNSPSAFTLSFASSPSIIMKSIIYPPQQPQQQRQQGQNNDSLITHGWKPPPSVSPLVGNDETTENNETNQDNTSATTKNNNNNMEELSLLRTPIISDSGQNQQQPELEPLSVLSWTMNTEQSDMMIPLSTPTNGANDDAENNSSSSTLPISPPDLSTTSTLHETTSHHTGEYTNTIIEEQVHVSTAELLQGVQEMHMPFMQRIFEISSQLDKDTQDLITFKSNVETRTNVLVNAIHIHSNLASRHIGTVKRFKSHQQLETSLPTDNHNNNDNMMDENNNWQ